jgi:hypothetical protein
MNDIQGHNHHDEGTNDIQGHNHHDEGTNDIQGHKHKRNVKSLQTTDAK